MQEDNFQIITSQEDIPKGMKNHDQSSLAQGKLINPQNEVLSLQQALNKRQELLEEKDMEIHFLLALFKRVKNRRVTEQKEQEQDFDDLVCEEQASEEHFQDLTQIGFKGAKICASIDELKGGKDEKNRKQLTFEGLPKLVYQKFVQKYSKQIDQIDCLNRQIVGKEYLIETYEKQIRQFQVSTESEESQNPISNLNSNYYMKQYIVLEEQMKTLQAKYEAVKDKTQRLNVEELQVQFEELLLKNQKLQSERIEISRKLNQLAIIREENRQYFDKIEHYGKIINQQGKCLVEKFGQNKNLEKNLAQAIERISNLEKANHVLQKRIQVSQAKKTQKSNTKPKFKDSQVFPMEKVNLGSGNPESLKSGMFLNYLQSKGGKNYLIRLAIEEHVQELIQGLVYMGGMDFYEIEEIVANQFIAITRFFNETIKQKIKVAKEAKEA